MPLAEISSGRKVIVTGDLWRPSNRNGISWDQRPNVAWLGALIRHFAGTERVRVWTPETFGESYSDFMRIQGLLCDNNAWIQSYRAPLAHFVVEALHDSDAGTMVGFEIPPSLVIGAREARMDVINLTLSPMRFLEDLLITVEVNGKIAEAFRRNAVSSAELRLRSAPMIAQIARERTYLRPPLIQGKAALFSQVSADRSLIAEDRFASFIDFREQIAGFAEEHSPVLLKIHPKEGLCGDAAQFIASIKNVFVTDRSAYDLITDEDVGVVAAMSSSVIDEALFFGKNALRILPLPRSVLDDRITLSFAGFVRALCSTLGLDQLPESSAASGLRNIVGMVNEYTTDFLSGYRRQPPLMPSKQTSFSDPSLLAALIQGFSPVEDWGVRMSQPHGVLEFASPSDLHGTCRYALTVQVTSATDDRPGRLLVYTAGILFEDRIVRDSGYIHLVIPITWEDDVRISQIHLILTEFGKDRLPTAFGHGLALWSISPM